MKRQLFIITVIFSVFVGSIVLWQRWLLALPKLSITRPATKMPSPNAYDFYVEAGIALLPPNKPVDAVQDKPLIPKSQWKTYYPIAKKQEWLLQNARSLHLVQKGIKYQSHISPRKSLLDNSYGRHELLRSIAHMLIVESRVYSEKGNWNRASKSALDTLKLGYDIAQGGAVIDSLYSVALTAPAYYEFWDILPHLNKNETQATADRLKIILKNRPKYSQVLIEEKYFGQVGMLDFFKYSQRWRLRSFVDEKGEFQWSSLPKILITSRRHMFQEYTAYMDKRIAQADLPYNASPSHIPIPADMYSQTIAPAYQRVYWNHSRAEAKAAFLAIELALHSYRLDNGHYPQTLSALLPRYINEIPVDPFGKGGTLRYKQTQHKYLLYSVGPDGKDDDGRAVENKKISKGKRSRYVLAPDSKGDFVAGINY